MAGRIGVVRAAVVVAMAAAASCTPSGGRSKDGRAAPRDKDVRPPARLGEHWIQDERLRAAMGQVSRHAERWPAGLPEGPASKESAQSAADADEAFRDASALAEGLAEAASQIPRSVADHPMSAEDRRGFAAEADRLRRQALELRRATRARQVEQMQRSLDQISSTCVSCHSQYRDFTGELGARKASAE